MDYATIPDSELQRCGGGDLLKIIRRLENEKINSMSEQSNMMKDINKRLQLHLMEIRGLKEVNQRLQDDNEELRDLCCFLDDDRQSGRKLAREWQRFGRYTSNVMKNEVSSYQQKLADLEKSQQHCINDNFMLKELCLFLDSERQETYQKRDQGDGSTCSGSMNSLLGDDASQISGLNPQAMNDQTYSYIKNLESRIQVLENEKKNKLAVQDLNLASRPPVSSPNKVFANKSNKPEAIVHALKVLELKDKVDQVNTEDEEDFDGSQRAIIRQMCNVVWRKLEKSPQSLSKRH